MIKTGLLSLIGLLSVILAPLAQSAPAKGFDAAAFDLAIAKVKQGDLSGDMKWLRQQNLIRFNYMPFLWWGDSKKAFDALKSEPANALKLAETRLAENYIDIEANFVAEHALNALGRGAEAKLHHDLIVAWIASIKDGNDGQSSDKPWYAISVDEEYLMFNFMGFKPGMQSLIKMDGHVFDKMDVTDTATGKSVTIWFNIDFFFGKEGGDPGLK
ncbi:MAG: DUF4919 domain-containing protein [Novosphingobium sp.]